VTAIASPALPLAPLWTSPFRPFCVLGAGYGVALMAAWLAARAGILALPYGALAPALWHAHEMLFGFAAAIICATTLTALPGWAGTPEIHGAPLATLAALWLAGRAAFWARDALPTWLVVAADGALYVALLAVVVPQLARVANRYYLLLPVVLAAMLAGDVLFLGGRPESGFKLALYAVVFLFALKAGVFTPVFTGSYLRANGRGDRVRFLVPLEYASVSAIVVLAAVDLAQAPRSWRAAAALAAFVLHAVRLARWRGWKVRDAPLLWTMHAGYAWMVAAFALLVAGDLGSAGAARAWVHAFTVGALGSMMLGLMTRMALRHTGRPLEPPPAMVAAYFSLQAAALLRVGAAFAAGEAWILGAGAAWVAAFALFLACFGAVLVSPSLPRVVVSPLAADTPSPRASGDR
jgi:uncharacterized protein involved in response to NO